MHTVIFSHGFGVRRDDRGLFTDIAGGLSGVESVMFDYNTEDPATNTITVLPYSGEAELLRKELERVREKDPNGTIDIIAHSQGCVVAALVTPEHVRKVVFLAAPHGADIESFLEGFRKRPGTIVDFEGVSSLKRGDCGTTFVPSEYWHERKELDVPALYRALATKTDLTVIQAVHDHILGPTDLSYLSSQAHVMELPGDHSFRNEARPLIVETVSKIIS